MHCLEKTSSVREMQNREMQKFLNSIQSYYDAQIRSMWNITHGGRLRALKGQLVEHICEECVKYAWSSMGGDPNRLSIGRKMYYFWDNEGNKYGLSQDKQVYIDRNFVLSIECKAYAELAMYKRVIVDCHILHSAFPELKFCLFLLESQLGGDYSTEIHPKGSPQVKVINSFFPHIKLDIVVLLDGERDVKKPIHKRQFYKPLNPKRVLYAINYFKNVLRPYL